MNSNSISKGILKALSVVIAVSMLLYFLYKIQSVIIYIATAAVISLIGRPIILFLTNTFKFKNILAVIVTMAILVSLAVGLIVMFIPLIIEQGQNLSLLNIQQLQNNIEDLYLEIINYFELNQIHVEESIQKSDLLSKINYAILPNLLNSVIGGLGSFSIGIFSVIFISFFFLKDSELFERGFFTFIPDDNESRWKKSLTKIKDLLSRYFVGLIFQILILFIIYTIVLFICGISNAIVIAFLCALLNLIPYVGPLVSAFLMIILSMSSNLGESFSNIILPKTTYVMIGFVIAQLIDNFFSQPFIFSKSVKSHPLEIFLIIIISGILFGVIGMIIAIPTYTAIKVILKEFLSENKIVQRLTKDL